jgi:N6-adenosine-specific RNA methylase IME4
MDLPTGPFACILADPPWQFTTFSAKGRDRCPDAPLSAKAARNLSRQNRPERHYATMSLDDIKALPVADVAAKVCMLLMWAVDPMLPQAIAVGEAWGFTYKTVGFYWAKLRREGSTRHLLHGEAAHKLFPMGTGYWTRANPEPCLLFTRGKPKRLSSAVRKLMIARRREHSRKPDEQYDAIEQLVAGPYLELFGRQTRPVWTTWGNDAGKFDAESLPLFGEAA